MLCPFMTFTVRNTLNGFRLNFCVQQVMFICEISGFHGGEYEVQSLLGYTAV
jgi:hypothetical protein